MPLAYLDCFAGLSGDLFLGALVDLGYPAEELRAITRRVVGDRARITVRREARHAVTGTRVVVTPTDAPHDALDTHHMGHAHTHDPAATRHEPISDHHAQPHDHEHSHPRQHLEPATQRHDHTPYREIRHHLSALDLPNRVKERSLETFERLSKVEGRIHGVPAEEVTFHEVGAVDALVDIVGTMAAVEWLGLDPIVCAPPVLGNGWVRTQHGTMPVPAPATLALLEGYPVRAQCLASGERTTPTGAALAVTLSSHFGDPPDLLIDRVGYGVASADPAELPNLLRVWVGRASSGERDHADSGLDRDTVDVVEAEIDDMNPEIFGFLAERLRDAGALDVLLTPVQMKKGRPGTSIRVLGSAGTGGSLAGILLRESTSTGARVSCVPRMKMPREVRVVDTPFGPVSIKIVGSRSTTRRIHPEFEDLRKIALATGVPLLEVERRVVAFLTDQERS